MLKTKTDSFTGRVHTLDYRIYGDMHPRANTGMADYLNSSDRLFLPITNAMVYNSTFMKVSDLDTVQAAPGFMAVPKDRILWVVGGNPSNQEPMKFEERRVAVCYLGYYLLGDMRILAGTRSSDHFNSRAMQKPFQALHNVSLCIFQSGKPFEEGEVIEKFEVLTVNLRNVASICEVEAATTGVWQGLIIGR